MLQFWIKFLIRFSIEFCLFSQPPDQRFHCYLQHFRGVQYFSRSWENTKKMVQKSSQNDTKIEPKSLQKSSKKRSPKNERKNNKMEPKWSQKASQNFPENPGNRPRDAPERPRYPQGSAKPQSSQKDLQRPQKVAPRTPK